ncbi:conjugal transfer protein TrbF [Asticcacaulis sp.]|uniref:conjugal transfer protein TrbF n=1 Tax=Asticcacaulis sp. TaxID=1872648 RepID=UPI002C7E47CA|nr:conjugal transfer protein TrbF [Asticcacaulis sp.]HTM82249.1 conjugal transfer protein TrbF [Asticcacaulis sp.]
MFKRTTATYGDTPKPETPYQRAAQAWDDRIGSARLQAKNWRLMAFGCLLLDFGLVGALTWQSTRGTIVPWVVQVDKLGQTQAVAPATAGFRPNDAQIAFQLAEFIAEVRSIPNDPVVVRSNWLKAYDFTTDRGGQALSGYAQANDPFAKVGTTQVAVEVVSVIRASADSFRLTWIERSYANGQLVSTARWSAIIGIIVDPPHDPERLRKNPLGIYVNSLNWSQEFNP